MNTKTTSSTCVKVPASITLLFTKLRHQLKIKLPQ
jgi:hypothetical protein